MSLEEYKLIKEAVASAMAGINSRIETLTDSVEALRREILTGRVNELCKAMFPDEEEIPDRAVELIQDSIEKLGQIPEGVKVTIILEEEK